VKLLAKLRLPSFFSATTEETHQIIRDNIRFSPLYAGAIQEAGNPAQDKMDRG
jgi:tRNA U34 5-carboxymethylaminomethyl modifying enzyme MnmG/GidA